MNHLFSKFDHRANFLGMFSIMAGVAKISSGLKRSRSYGLEKKLTQLNFWSAQLVNIFLGVVSSCQ